LKYLIAISFLICSFLIASTFSGFMNRGGFGGLPGGGFFNTSVSGEAEAIPRGCGCAGPTPYNSVRSFVFDGVDEYLLCGVSDDYKYETTDPFSITGFIAQNSPSGSYRILSTEDRPTSNRPGYDINGTGVSPIDTLRFTILYPI